MMKLQFSTLNVLIVNVTLNNKVHDYNICMFVSKLSSLSMNNGTL